MTDSLQKHYSLLSPQERLTLYLRALGRGDTAERDAVIAATPKVQVSMGDFFPDLDALQTMNLLHLLAQMDAMLGVLLFLHGEDKPAEQWRAAQLMAQEYLNTQEAWRVFADEHGLAGDKLQNALAGSLLPFFTTCRSEPLVEKAAHWAEGCEDHEAIKLVPPSVADKLHDYRLTFAELLARGRVS
jgi:hypothetical protein